MDTERCGAYVLLGRIGGGGMADVFAARLPDALRLDDVVAIKRLRTPLAKEQRYRLMFEDETRIAACVRHTHVVPILGHGIDASDLPYIVMPLVDGVTLGTLLDESVHLDVSVAPALVAEVIAQAAEGLHAAHIACAPDGTPLQIVHRDVSPANILVERSGRVRVADFGVAWAAERVTRTVAGELKGNLRYLSPEQLRNEPLDQRSDVFSLGIVAWEALTGRPLFGADNPAAALHQILHEDIPPATAPPALARCIARALEKDPARRYWSAAEFANALRKSTPHTNRAQIAHWVRRVAIERIEERKRMLTEAARVMRESAPELDTENTPSQPLPSIAPGRPSFPWKVVIVASLLGFGFSTTFLLGRQFVQRPVVWSAKTLTVEAPAQPLPDPPADQESAPAAATSAAAPSVVMTSMMSPTRMPATPADPEPQPSVQEQEELRIPDYGMLVDPWQPSHAR